MATRWRWPPGELAGVALEERGEAEDLGGAVHLLLDLSLGGSLELEGEGHVLQDGHVGVERIVLEHHGDVPLFGGTWLTTREPMRISPPVMVSSPAIMRSNVDLPQPEGPTRITNSPSAMSTDTPCRTGADPYDLRTALMRTGATADSI
jgi:hypothetical protein